MTQSNKQRGCCDALGDVISTRFMKALCDPNRVALLSSLATKGEASTVTEAAGCCAVDLSVVSRHLALLRDAGILASEKRGREVYYSVRVDAVVETLRSIADALEACCGTASPDAGKPDPGVERQDQPPRAEETHP